MKDEVLLTIFTPTYNRAKTLPRLYDSLAQQNNKDFEWLIVDDGSSDETDALIHRYIDEGSIRVRYIYKENGGKHTALNVGIKHAVGHYFMCVDSDDFLECNAVETLSRFIIREDPNGIIAYKSEYPSKDMIGKEFPSNISETTLFELINTWKSSGDRSLIFKTELIKGIHIPEPKDCRFFPETFLYDRFDEKYKSKLLRKSICCCEYLEGGYSSDFRMLMILNAGAMKWFYAARIDFPCSLRIKFQSSYRYIAYSLLAKCKEGRYKGKNWPILFFAIPFGLAMYFEYWLIRRKGIGYSR